MHPKITEAACPKNSRVPDGFLVGRANYITERRWRQRGRRQTLFSALEWTVSLHQLRISISLIKPCDTRGSAPKCISTRDEWNKKLKNKLMKGKHARVRACARIKIQRGKNTGMIREKKKHRIKRNTPGRKIKFTVTRALCRGRSREGANDVIR